VGYRRSTCYAGIILFYQHIIMEKKSTPEQMTTLVSCLAKAREDGYKEDFKVVPEGLCTLDSKHCYPAEEVRVRNFYRFEGVSDPADNVILYIIETKDGCKGTLSDGYGPYADPNVGAFMEKVESINKKS
jgi:hypothetical protein